MDDYTNPSLKLYDNNTQRIQNVKALQASTLLVVVDDLNSDMGKKIAEVFSHQWKFNSYKIIPYSEMEPCLTKAQYSFFVFAEQDAWMNMGSRELIRKMYINPNNKPDQTAYNNYFIYAMFRGGNEIDDKGIVKKIPMAEYVINAVTIYGKGFEEKTLGEIESGMLACLPQIVDEMQSDLYFMMKNNSVPIFETEPIKLYLNYESKDIKARTAVYYYNKSNNQVETETILIDSALGDSKSIQYLTRITNIKAQQIHLVSKQEIQAAIDGHQPGVLYVKQLCSSFNDGSGSSMGAYRICNTNGEKLADFSGTVYSITEGSVLNPKATLMVDLFSKTNTPADRAKIQYEN